MFSQSAALATSARSAVAVPPACWTSRTVSCAAFSLRSTATTLAPSRANSSADSRPMPLPAPVMTATLFLSRIVAPSGFGMDGLDQRVEQALLRRVALRGQFGVPLHGDQ